MNKATPLVVQLPDDARIVQAKTLAERLQALLEPGVTVELDGSGVLQVDTCTMQVLASFIRDAEAIGVDVRWSAVSKQLRARAGLIGLSHVLESSTRRGRETDVAT